MSRDHRLVLGDIQRGCLKVLRWTAGLTREQLGTDEMRCDAVMRNLQIIGEAVKQLPTDFRERETSVPWRQIAGFRDVVTHVYFGVDDDIVWDVIQTKAPDLLRHVTLLLAVESDDKGSAGA